MQKVQLCEWNYSLSEFISDFEWWRAESFSSALKVFFRVLLVTLTALHLQQTSAVLLVTESIWMSVSLRPADMMYSWLFVPQIHWDAAKGSTKRGFSVKDRFFWKNLEQSISLHCSVFNLYFSHVSMEAREIINRAQRVEDVRERRKRFGGWESRKKCMEEEQYPVMVHIVSVVSEGSTLMHCISGPKTILQMRTAWRICISIICGCHKYTLLELSAHVVSYKLSLEISCSW